MMIIHRIWAACLAAGLLTGCVRPDVPPVLSLQATGCTVSPNLEGPMSLPFVSGKTSGITADIRDNSACLEGGGLGTRLYRVVALPETTEPYSMVVTAKPEGRSVFAFRVTMLGQDGSALRTLDRQSFNFRGNAMSAFFRPRAGERYLLIESDPTIVGENYARIVSNVETTAVGAGGATLTLGRDRTTNVTFSHAGKLLVVVVPVPSGT